MLKIKLIIYSITIACLFWFTIVCARNPFYSVAFTKLFSAFFSQLLVLKHILPFKPHNVTIYRAYFVVLYECITFS